MTKLLTGKTIVITGASSGAGRAGALEFAKHDTNLVLAARNEPALQDIAAECREAGAHVLVVVTDMADAQQAVKLANAALAWQGNIDVWVNNAGVLAAGAFEDTPMAIHEQVIKTNLLGYMHGAHAVLSVFKQQQYGTLINNISIGGFLPVPYGAAYTSSKFGLRGFSEALKGELANWPGIHVCDLFPAFLNTPGIQHAANYTGKVLKPAPPVSDPFVVGRAMVKAAAYPRANSYPTSVSFLFKAAHALFPKLTTNITGLVMRKYFQIADPSVNTSGNVLGTVEYGMGTHGNMHIVTRKKQQYLLVGLVAGLAVGACALVASKKK